MDLTVRVDDDIGQCAAIAEEGVHQPSSRSPSNICNFKTGVERYQVKNALSALDILKRDRVKLMTLKTSGSAFEEQELYERNKHIKTRFTVHVISIMLGFREYEDPEHDVIQWDELKDAVACVQEAISSGRMVDIARGKIEERGAVDAERVIAHAVKNGVFEPHFKRTPSHQCDSVDKLLLSFARASLEVRRLIINNASQR